MDSGGGGGAFAASCWPSRLSWCLALRLPGGAILLNESPVNRGPDDLVGGDGHSVEPTKARNQS